MATENYQFEVLEQKISEFQKLILIKRGILKKEIENENDEETEVLQSEITELKEKILFYQGELRKKYLHVGNRKIEETNEKLKLKTETIK